MPDLFNWMMVFLRGSAMISVFPLLSAAQIPKQVRIALAAMLSFLVAPLLPVNPAPPQDIWSMIGLMAMEVGFGLLLGFVSRMFLYILEIAGAFMASEIGLNMPGGMNPFTSTSTTEIGTILQYLGMMLFLSLNLHHGLLIAFQRSYVFLPVGGGHLSDALVLEVVRRTGQLFWFGMQMAAPVLAVCFIITLVFSVLSRAVPQMNAFSENFAVRLLAGLTVFGLTCHLMAEHMANYLSRLPDDVLRLAQILGAR